MGYAEQAKQLDEATSVAVSNPKAGLPLAREALRACRWTRCLRIRSAAVLGFCLSALGRLERSERVFLAAYRVAAGCPCCLLAAQALTQKGGRKRRSLWCRARKFLRLAHDRLLRLELQNKAAAAWADLAAVQAVMDRFELADLEPASPPVFADLAATAKRWADSVEPGATAQMWGALRELRDATDCGPALVPYTSELA
jgi:hypothetical protein